MPTTQPSPRCTPPIGELASRLIGSYSSLSLVPAAPPDVLTKLSLKSTPDAHALVPGAIDKPTATTRCAEMDADLQTTGRGLDEWARLLAAIVHLGDVTFVENDHGAATLPGDVKKGTASRTALTTAAGLLGVGSGELEERVTQRILSVGMDDVIKPLPVAEASAERDALVKAIFQRLFALLVEALNPPSDDSGSGNSTGAARTIGMLDIFGFESLSHNSLEQLCSMPCTATHPSLFFHPPRL